jgi:hypothetical protein
VNVGSHRWLAATAPASRALLPAPPAWHVEVLARETTSITAGGLSALSHHIRAAAVVLDNGEVMWTFAVATEAIDDLARHGRVLLGVDVRERDEQGLVTEVPISCFEPCGGDVDVERSRLEARAAVSRAEAVTGWQRPMVLLTWR